MDTSRHSAHKTLRWYAALGLYVFPVLIWTASLTHAGEVIAVPSAGITAIGQAMVGAKSGDTIGVCNGVYPEHLHVKPGVTLLAGSRGNAILDGRGKGTVVTLGAHASVIGFEIRNGAIGVV
jgi:nitrous oxidase accessory protein NosD